jgi:hypothetical protein
MEFKPEQSPFMNTMP